MGAAAAAGLGALVWIGRPDAAALAAAGAAATAAVAAIAMLPLRRALAGRRATVALAAAAVVVAGVAWRAGGDGGSPAARPAPPSDVAVLVSEQAAIRARSEAAVAGALALADAPELREDVDPATATAEDMRRIASAAAAAASRAAGAADLVRAALDEELRASRATLERMFPGSPVDPRGLEERVAARRAALTAMADARAAELVLVARTYARLTPAAGRITRDPRTGDLVLPTGVDAAAHAADAAALGGIAARLAAAAAALEAADRRHAEAVRSEAGEGILRLLAPAR
jgi:hypothetical protein